MIKVCSLVLFATVDGRVFKFYTELTSENYNNIYIQKPANSRVVKFCVVLTSVTNSRDHFGLYLLTGSTSVSMNMFTLTATVKHYIFAAS